MRERSPENLPVSRNRSSSAFCSVIVRAHDRRHYLRQAVESILAQDVDQNRYEIIVVKNYRDESIDAFLSRVNAQTVFCDAESGTQKAAEGFRISKGDVLLFLDDDDIFEPNRIKVILTEFDKRPELGFYRNQVAFVGPDGEKLSPNKIRAFGFHPPNRIRRLYIEGDRRHVGALRLAKASSEFNTSSMAIRRELFEPGIPYLYRMSTTLDTLLWFEGFTSDRSILIDNRALTRYRIHNSNFSIVHAQSRDEREAKMLELARSHDRDYRIVGEFVASTGQKPAIRQIEARLLMSRLTILLQVPFPHRIDFLRVYLEAAQCYDGAPIWEDVGEIGASLLYLLAPASARKLYQRRIGIS